MIELVLLLAIGVVSTSAVSVYLRRRGREGWWERPLVLLVFVACGVLLGWMLSRGYPSGSDVTTDPREWRGMPAWLSYPAGVIAVFATGLGTRRGLFTGLLRGRRTDGARRSPSRRRR
jgi:hypothetical protein